MPIVIDLRYFRTFKHFVFYSSPNDGEKPDGSLFGVPFLDGQRLRGNWPVAVPQTQQGPPGALNDEGRHW